MKKIIIQFLGQIIENRQCQKIKQTFQKFQQMQVRSPQDWQFCNQLLGYQDSSFNSVLISEKFQTLIEKIYQVTTQQKGAYASFISYLVTKGLYSRAIQSQKFIFFLLQNFYILGDQIYPIFQAIMTDQIKSKQICDFFHMQIRQQNWQKEGSLKKNRRRYPKSEFVGLKNPHSICYANSFIQQLFHIDQFREQLLKTSWQRNNLQSNQDLVWQLKITFATLKYYNEPFFNHDFFNAFKDLDGEPTALDVQMDVDEFKNILLDRLQNKIPKQNNFIKEIFTGKQATTIKSLECEHSSKREEQYTSVCLDVKNLSNLNDSLQNYSKSELFEGQNAYDCQQCKRKVRAQKHIQIIQFPKILIFVLKRFQFIIYRRRKINSKFQFPLDTFEIQNGVHYQLKGIIIHQGVSQAGHYFSLIKKKQKWYQFNDSFIGEISIQTVQQLAFGQDQQKIPHSNKNAYVLVYQKINQNAVKEISSVISFQQQTKKYPYLLDQIMKIKTQMHLRQKQQKFFDSGFINFLVKAFKRFSYTHILTLIVDVFLNINSKLQDQTGYLIDTLRLIRQNKNSLSFLYTDYFIQVFFKLICRNDRPIFQIKNVVIDLYVSNYSLENLNIQRKYDLGVDIRYSESGLVNGCSLSFFYQFIDHLIRMIYNESCQSSCFFQFFEKLCRKTSVDKSFIKYLQERAIVFRILDITFVQILGQAVRSDIKSNNTILKYQFSSPFNYNKDLQRKQYRYKKWSFLTYLIQNSVLSDDEQQLIYKRQTHALRAILSQCSTKVNLNYVAKYFSVLSKKNPEFSLALIKFLFVEISRQNSQSIRKCFKIMKQLLKIQDSKTNQRHQTIVDIFNETLKRQYQSKHQGLFDLTWCWVLKIAKKNQNIQQLMRSNQKSFSWLGRLMEYNFSYFRMKQSRIQRNKHRYHGIKLSRNPQQFRKNFQQKVQLSKDILQGNIIVYDQNDSDEDVTNFQFIDQNYFLKFNEQQNQYEKHKIVFAIDDAIFYQVQQNNQQNISITSKSNERLMPFYSIESQTQQVKVEELEAGQQSSISASNGSNRTSMVGPQDCKRAEDNDFI